MSHHKSSSVFALALLFALVAAPKPMAAILGDTLVLAQSATPSPFPLPDTVAAGTTVRIDGSNSMGAVNQSLKQQFEEQYAGTSVADAYNGTTAALQSLTAGDIDLAAIGRPLTAAEKAEGLTEMPVGRSKIAIIVGEANPFTGNLTFEQFAQIFRGEITDWSQVGGAPGPIRLIDHPADSDTRQAFRNYPVFQNAPFESGATALSLTEDSATAIVAELGSDGISYITANQVVDRPDVRIVPMHQTLPTDPRYPYSQPLVYVYRGQPSPTVASFLGFATAPVGQAAVAAAGAAIAADPGAVASPAATTDPETIAPASPEAVAPSAASPASPTTEADQGAAVTNTETNTERKASPWLWLLPLLLAIPFLLWLFGRRRGAAPPEELLPAVPPIAATPPEPKLADRTGTVISADRTAIADVRPPAPVVPETPPSPPVEPPISLPAVGAALVGGAALAGLTGVDRRLPNRIVFTPRTTRQAYAYWEAPEENRRVLQQQGGKHYTLKIYDATGDATGVNTGSDLEQPLPHSIQELACEEADSDRWVANLQSDRDYIAEIGYLTDNNQWLALARSAPIRMPSENPLPDEVESGLLLSRLVPARVSGAEPAPDLRTGVDPTIADGQQEAVEATKFNLGQPDLRGEDLADVDAHLPALADGYGDSQIFLLPRDPNWAYTYWDVPNQEKAALRQQGGSRLALRFYDVTGINLDQQRPHSLQQYDCDELSRDWYLPVPVSDRDYIVEIGYLTHDGRWLMLARSNPARIPPIYPSGWLDDQFVTVDWEEDLRGQTQLQLPQPASPSYGNPIYDRIFNLVKSAESQRIAGSLFASMQPVPEQSLSSYSVSGLGMASLTESGMGMMSGIGVTGMSGAAAIGMSGIGISSAGIASMPNISGVGMSGVGLGVAGMSGVSGSGIGAMGMSGVGVTGVSGAAVPGMSGIGITGMSGVGMMSGVGITGMSGVGMSGVGMMSGIGMYSISSLSGTGFTASGVGMSGVGMMSIPTMSGIGMSGMGIGLTMSGVGMSGVGMMNVPTMSGVGYTLSGVGMSGAGMGYTLSGVGMSGVGIYSIPTMSGIGMSGVGMGLTISGIGMSGVGMSGIGMSGVGFGASIPPIRPRKFWLVANAELIVHGATEPDATVLVGDREIKLSPDGTFRFQVAFPDGKINYPILAVAADGEQTRSVRMDFNRETPVENGNTKAEAVEEWLQ